MINDLTQPAAARSGLSAMRRAFTATLAIVFVGLLGWGLSWPALYLLARVESLGPYMPVISAATTIVVTTALPLLLGFLYFTGRAQFFTGWSQKLHPFFHLSDRLPGFPAVLGLAWPRGKVTFKKVSLWAVGGLALVHLFDYLSVRFFPELHSYLGLRNALNPLEAMSGPDFYIAAGILVTAAPFAEELLRGLIINLWRPAFAAQEASFRRGSGRLPRACAGFFAMSGPCLAIVIAAFLFALLHMEGWLSQFVFGLIAGVLYLATRTIWTPVLMHVLSNLILAVTIFVGAAPSGSLALPTGREALAQARSDESRAPKAALTEQVRAEHERRDSKIFAAQRAGLED